MLIREERERGWEERERMGKVENGFLVQRRKKPVTEERKIG